MHPAELFLVVLIAVAALWAWEEWAKRRDRGED